MKQTVTDKLISKFSKNKINTIRVTRDEMADMIDQYFIQKAVTEEEYQAIWKVVKRGLFLINTFFQKMKNMNCTLSHLRQVGVCGDLYGFMPRRKMYFMNIITGLDFMESLKK